MGIEAVAEIRRGKEHVGSGEIVIDENRSEAQFHEDAGAVIRDAHIACDAGVFPPVVEPDAERGVVNDEIPSITPLRKRLS